MKHRFIIEILGCMMASACALGQTYITAQKIIDNHGSLLRSGQMCYGTTCFRVTNGAIPAGSTVTPNTANLSIMNGATVYLTVPSVSIASSVFDFDGFSVPSTGLASGIGVPRISCIAGARYIQTDGNGNLWACKQINGVAKWEGIAGPPRSPAITIGAVSTTLPGTPATVTNTGTLSDFVINTSLPQGVQGPIGAPTSAVNLTPTVNQDVIQPPGTNMRVSSLNGVLNATLFAGSDAGAKINAAYAALPARGGMIIYPVASGGEAFSTPIVFGTANKPVVLSCQGASGASSDLLTYSGAGTGITFNNGPGLIPNGPAGSGIRDCDFLATSNSATLLFMGGLNGAEGALVANSKFFGGGLTVGIGDNTWHIKFDHDSIGSGVQLFATSGATNAGENVQLDHVVFGNSINFANGVVFGGGASGPGLNLQCNACSFDNAQLVVAGGIVEINSTHFEDPGTIVWPAPPYVQTGGLASINTATFFGDHPSATPALIAYMAVSAGMLTTDSIDTFGCNCTNIYASSGTGHIVGRTPLTLAGPGGATVNLIADTSSERSTVDGGREYALHAESPYSIGGVMTFLPTGGIHLRGNSAQSAIGTYLDPATRQTGDIRFTGTPDMAGYFTSKIIGRNCDNLAYNSALDFYTEKKTTANQTDTSTVAARLDCNKVWKVPAVVSMEPTFTISGCSATTPLGGATAGQFNAGVSGTCTVTVTMGNGIAAPHGWACGRPNDISNASKSTSWSETAFTQTTVTLSGNAAAGDLIQFGCTGY